MEVIILSGLMYNPKYAKKVLPFLRSSYFHDTSQKHILKIIHKFFQKYNTAPSKEILKEELELSDVNENLFEGAAEVIQMIDNQDSDYQWLVDKTEEFCQEKAIFKAIETSIAISEGEEPELTKHSIPELLKSALAVDFNTEVGHDFLEDAGDRWDYYNRTENRIKFDIDVLNTITNGGIPTKTLNVILAGCVHPNTMVRLRLTKL